MINLLLVQLVNTDMSGSVESKTFFEKMNDGLFGNIAEFISNCLVYWPFCVFVLVMLVFLFTFKKRTKDVSKHNINTLKKNGKYIKGVFVELNDTKELLRYFMHGDSWRKRIIADYNNLFDDENGRRLKKIYKDYGIAFKISKSASIKKVYEEINSTLELMRKIRKRECEAPENYKDTAMLFEVLGYRYIEKLEKLYTRTEFIKNKYIVLTGSAGNGKTNLLCNLVETMINNKKICVFYNVKEINQNMCVYFENSLMPCKNKYFRVYWSIQHILCVLLNRSMYIVIDAINESRSHEFMKSLSDFINKMLKYRKVKIIVSCRSEYFDFKYKNILIDRIDEGAYCYDIMKEEYSYVAKKRLYENYKKAFNYSGELSEASKEKLYSQLLLMRMFFEVHKNSDVNVNSLNKYEIFQRYIDAVFERNKPECEAFLNKIVAHMYSNNKYSAIPLSEIMKESEMTGAIKDIMDETILVSRKLILHENSIIEKYDEEIYFVFEELRDYCVAKYALNSFIDDGERIDVKEVITYIDKLVETNAVCTEGVINYIYWFYKGQDNADMCKTILNRFMKPHDNAIEAYRMNRENGLNSWGLKVILDGDDDLEIYEKDYLKYIIMNNPGHELARLFLFLINQEMINGKYNLELLLENLYEIHIYDEFCSVLKETVSYWNIDGINHDDFIEIDKKLQFKNIEGCKRFRCYLFLYLEFLSWEGKEEIQEYFESHCNKQDIICNLKGRIYFETEDK